MKNLLILLFLIVCTQSYSQMYELKPVPFSSATVISEDDSFLMLIEEKTITISFGETQTKLSILHVVESPKETLYNCKDENGLGVTVKIYDTQNGVSDFYFYSSKISYMGCLTLVSE
jgi:hypothetical protein